MPIIDGHYTYIPYKYMYIIHEYEHGLIYSLVCVRVYIYLYTQIYVWVYNVYIVPNCAPFSKALAERSRLEVQTGFPAAAAVLIHKPTETS